MDKMLGTGIKMTVELIKTIGAVCASLMAIATLCGGVWWLVRRVVRISDAVQQLRPNGGSSLADKVNHISKTMDTISTNVSTLTARVDGMEVFDTEVRDALKEINNDKRRRRR